MDLRLAVYSRCGEGASGTDGCLSRGLRRAALLCAAALVIASCGADPSARLESPGQIDLTAKTPQKVTTRNEGPALKTRTQQARYEVFPGVNAPLTDDGGEPPPGVGAQDDGTFTVNVDQASVGEAAKLILGETLGYNYTIDPRVQGTVTLVSNRPLSTRELLSAFEASLRLSNAVLIQSEGVFKIVATQEVLDGEMGTADFGKGISPGYGVNAIPLRYVAAANIMELVDTFIARTVSVRASKVGNMILIRGPAAERRALVEVVLSFDVDWMKSQSSSIATLENARAEEVGTRLQQIFAEDSAASGPNALKVIPVPSINGLIVIANDKGKVQRAITWIRRLDRESINAPNYYVYAVQNGNSVELARILNSTFGSGADAGPTAEVAPNQRTTDVSMEPGASDSQQQQTPGGDGMQPPPPDPQSGDSGLTTGSTSPDAAQDQGTSFGGSASGTRITANPANNTIVIRATPQEYRKILATLRQIDASPTQVLINTTIAEVSLNDQLRYGVQAYFDGQDAGFIFNGNKPGAGSAVISPQLPGMNFLVGGISDPKVVIDALSGITNVRVVSSPSLLVLENETATIKVGDQVPILTQTSQTTGGNPIESYEYRDTGVILKVKPRVSAAGVVTIELGQELSKTDEAAAAGAAKNPTFSQRSISSKVQVNDQQTVLLGGLISGSEERGRNTVPGADKVPLLGKLVGTTNNVARRTELIIFITPKIIRNGEEAARESQQLREKMKNLNFN